MVQNNDRVVHEIGSILGIVPAKNSISISEIFVWW